MLLWCAGQWARAQAGPWTNSLCETRVLPYEKIYNGNINEQIAIFEIFERSLEVRERKQIETELPCDPDECFLSLIGTQARRPYAS